MIATISKQLPRAHRATRRSRSRRTARWALVSTEHNPHRDIELFRSYRSADGRWHRMDVHQLGRVVRIHLIDLRKRDRRGYATWRCLQLAERDDRAEFYRLLEETVG